MVVHPPWKLMSMQTSTGAPVTTADMARSLKPRSTKLGTLPSVTSWRPLKFSCSKNVTPAFACEAASSAKASMEVLRIGFMDFLVVIRKRARLRARGVVGGCPRRTGMSVRLRTQRLLRSRTLQIAVGLGQGSGTHLADRMHERASDVSYLLLHNLVTVERLVT